MRQNPGKVVAEHDEEMVSQVASLFKDKIKRPKMIIESGTYHGTGTTLQVAEAVSRALMGKPGKLKFITIEADSRNYQIAKKNLAAYKWIRVIHGTSVSLQEAVEFIQTDEMLINHEQYPDVLMDAKDPIPFYLAEIQGSLPVFGGDTAGQDDILGKMVDELRSKTPLFILDSCGGIGWLEFRTVMEIMGARPYYVWLHDIAHVKHIRSYDHILQNPDEWTALYERPSTWILAEHRG